MILGLIPSRLNSTRLKHKPLLIIDGLPIIVHTFKRAMLSKKLDDVVVCCDDEKIKNVVEKYGGKAIITSKNHKNGTERIYEYAKKIQPSLVIDIQGDEPLVDPRDIDKVISFHNSRKEFDIIVPCMEADNNEVTSRNLVKVVFSNNNKILYFSRSAVPYRYKNTKIKLYRDLSIVSFKFSALKKYNSFSEGKIEKIEGIELIRAIENGLNLGTFIAKNSGFAVDVNEDLMKAINIMPNDKIRKRY